MRVLNNKPLYADDWSQFWNLFPDLFPVKFTNFPINIVNYFQHSGISEKSEFLHFQHFYWNQSNRPHKIICKDRVCFRLWGYGCPLVVRTCYWKLDLTFCIFTQSSYFISARNWLRTQLTKKRYKKNENNLFTSIQKFTYFQHVMIIYKCNEN